MPINMFSSIFKKRPYLLPPIIEGLACRSFDGKLVMWRQSPVIKKPPERGLVDLFIKARFRIEWPSQRWRAVVAAPVLVLKQVAS